MMKTSPGVMKSVIERTQSGAIKGVFESMHSVRAVLFHQRGESPRPSSPTGCFVITRVTGPFFGLRREAKEARREQEYHLAHQQPATSPPAPEKIAPPEAKKDERPATKIDAAAIEHHQAAAVTGTMRAT
ncbi:MAG: hypothetical protein WDN72_05620 [Alphaproteobacteria bacterium]